MRIKTKLRISIVASVLTLLLISFVLYHEKQQDEEMTAKTNISEKLVKDVFEMNILIYDSLQHLRVMKKRVYIQWQLKHKSLSKLLSTIQSKDKQEQFLLDDIKNNLNYINLLFQELNNTNDNMVKTSVKETALSLETEKNRIYQILGRSQSVVSIASQIYEINFNRLSSVHNRIHVFIIVLIISLTLLIIILSYFINRGIAVPISEISEDLKVLGRGDFNYELTASSNSEISQIVRAINLMTKELKETTVSRDILIAEVEERIKIEKDLHKKTRQLEELTCNLEKKADDEIKKRLQKEQMLIQQTKMAAMGEMMAAVAHQWKQPLNIVGLIIQDFKDAWNYKEIDDDYIDKTVKEVMKQINFMSNTLNDFKNFFNPCRRKETFDLIGIAANVFSLLSHQFKVNKISYRITCHVHNESFGHYSEVIPCDAITITSYKNYLSHVILNIISNSRDAIVDRKQKGLMDAAKEGMILVDVYRDDDTLRMEISDSGGGIPDEIIDKIFDPYFTTKEGEKGTGIGLYMSKMIVEDAIGGKLDVRNIDSGAVFTIELKT
ncbi:MAG: HAMP domain-containing protein [Nitrospirae bacterium]|nr:HAMP domain-containing protein [Nitrospirota bacterium]MBF0534832.1 HAMP domain-containing protein [Nitrospirota bacterium]MBF0616747.1 HAMP domain-containing protein [Nitrospirota bacterium]